MNARAKHMSQGALLAVVVYVCLAAATLLQVYQGGTGASTAAGARTNLGAAQEPVNGDITAMTAPQSIAMNALTSPAGAPSGTATTCGGTVTNPTTYGKFAAFDAGGNLTAGSPISTAVTLGGNNCISWTFTPVAGAVSYRFYIALNTLFTSCRYFAASGSPFVQTLPFASGTSGCPQAGNNTGSIANALLINPSAHSLTISQSSVSDGFINFTELAADVTGLEVNGIRTLAMSDQASTPSSSPDIILQDPAGTQGGGVELLVNTTNAGQILFANSNVGTSAYFDQSMNLELIGTGGVGSETGNAAVALLSATHLNQQATGNYAGTCTMTGGACPAQTISPSYSGTPVCQCTWNGTGTLTGLIKCIHTASSITPTSTINTDTAHIDWHCDGNPN